MLSLLQLVSLLPLTFAISQYTTPSQWVPAPTNGTDALAAEGLYKLETYLDQHQANSTCSLKTAIRRKDWDTLVPEEKRDYLNAVRCLQTLPSIAGDSIPGARSRFDDFVGVHMNQTLTIHNTVYLPQQHLSTNHTDNPAGKLLPLAPMVRLHIRTSSPRRMRLQRLPTLPQLGSSHQLRRRLPHLRRL
jgi:tyrosinase